MSVFALHTICFALLLPAMPGHGDGGDDTGPVSRMSHTADGTGRLQTQVTLNGKGPYWFLIDTASTTSALSPTLAARLQLRPDGRTQIIGGIGTAPLRSVSVDDYRSDIFERQNERMTLLPGLSSDGVVGMNASMSSAHRVRPCAGQQYVTYQ